MKQLLFLFTFCLLTSCNKRIVQLPETTNKDITEVIDVSPVYMFYDEETDSVEFNRRNMISATNWLVNIDKRLTLKQILPHLQYLQEKRQGGEKHSFHNYFTCNNTDLKNLSFIEFTDVNFMSNILKKEKQKDSLITYFGSVRFNAKSDISLSYTNDEHGVSEKYNNISDLLNEVNSISEDGKFELNITFNSKLSFQDYIGIKTKLLTINSENLKISNQEIIYN